MENFSVTKTIRSPVPLSGGTGLLRKIKDEVLGKNFVLGLVFVGDKLSRNLNKKYRRKDKPTNVLSFPLSKTEGEIFINIPLAKKEARYSGTSLKSHLVYLFVHGLLHLKGFEHGGTMERREQELLKKFSIRH